MHLGFISINCVHCLAKHLSLLFKQTSPYFLDLISLVPTVKKFGLVFVSLAAHALFNVLLEIRKRKRTAFNKG